MKIEQPRARGAGTIEERVAYLESYIYRLTQQLQAVLNQLEGKKGN